MGKGRSEEGRSFCLSGKPTDQSPTGDHDGGEEHHVGTGPLRWRSGSLFKSLALGSATLLRAAFCFYDGVDTPIARAASGRTVRIMSTQTLLIIIVLVLLLGGGGFYWMR